MAPNVRSYAMRVGLIAGWSAAGLLALLLFVLSYPPILEYHAGFQEGVYRVAIDVRNRTRVPQMVKVFLLNPARPEANPYAHWVEQEVVPGHGHSDLTYFVGQDPAMSDVYVGVAAFRYQGSLEKTLVPQNLTGFYILHRHHYRWGDVYGRVDIGTN